MKNKYIEKLFIYFTRFRKIAPYTLIIGILLFFFNNLFTPVIKHISIGFLIHLIPFIFYIQLIGGILLLLSIVALLVPLFMKLLEY
ncbi:MAG: hypothetical protein ACQESP_02845 [Candidatus Muiribacteriota bacterium]